MFGVTNLDVGCDLEMPQVATRLVTLAAAGNSDPDIKIIWEKIQSNLEFGLIAVVKGRINVKMRVCYYLSSIISHL